MNNTLKESAQRATQRKKKNLADLTGMIKILPQYVIFTCKDMMDNEFEVKFTMEEILNKLLGKNGRVNTVENIELK